MIAKQPYLLRAARPDEIPLLGRIEQAAAQRFATTAFAWVADDTQPDLAALRRSQAADGLLVADCGGLAVGFLQFMPLDGAAYIAELNVLPTHAGHGLGAQLIDATAERAMARGLNALTLTTFRAIPWNAPYYKRLGFFEMQTLSPGLAVIRDKHRAKGLTDADRVFMSRPLASSRI
jgi:GNAT superfamily N-acetyltransferase